MEIISKSDFTKAITEIRDVWDYHSKLNKFFSENRAEGYLFQPDCIITAVNLLHLMFGSADADEWISYFCFDLDFGRDWKPGSLSDATGKDIKLQTPEDLYDFLTEELRNGS